MHSPVPISRPPPAPTRARGLGAQVLCKLVNVAVPDAVFIPALNLGARLKNTYRRLENANLAINSARRAPLPAAALRGLAVRGCRRECLCRLSMSVLSGRVSLCEFLVVPSLSARDSGRLH